MSLNILGGSSTVGSISITSDEFCSTARYSKRTGKISYKVKPLPRLVKFVLKAEKRYLIPQTLKLLAFFIGNLKLRDLIFISALICVVRLLESELRGKIAGSQIIILTTVWLVLLLFVKIKIAGFHGAEHMAIAAYERNESTDLCSVNKESPINPKCGGRMALPLALTVLVLIYFNLHWSFFILSTEAMLWIDKKIGFDKIPIFSQSSILLQRYITTAYPTEHQTRTAQIAMIALIGTSEDTTSPRR